METHWNGFDWMILICFWIKKNRSALSPASGVEVASGSGLTLLFQKWLYNGEYYGESGWINVDVLFERISLWSSLWSGIGTSLQKRLYDEDYENAKIFFRWSFRPKNLFWMAYEKNLFLNRHSNLSKLILKIDKASLKLHQIFRPHLRPKMKNSLPSKINMIYQLLITFTSWSEGYLCFLQFWKQRNLMQQSVPFCKGLLKKCWFFIVRIDLIFLSDPETCGFNKVIC